MEKYINTILKINTIFKNNYILMIYLMIYLIMYVNDIDKELQYIQYKNHKKYINQ